MEKLPHLPLLWSLSCPTHHPHRLAEALTSPGALALVQHPLIGSEGRVEPHGVIERDHELHCVVLVRQQGRPQECVVRDVRSHAAVQLHVTFT